MKKWAETFAVFKNVLIKYTEGELKHKMMSAIAKGEHRWYKRLNVDRGLHNLKLDNWEKGSWFNPETGQTKVVNGGKTLSRMEEVTSRYLTRTNIESPGGLKEYQPPKIVLQQIAERLVRHRRLGEATKAEDPKRWQTHMGQWLTGELQPEDAMRVPPPPHRRKRSQGNIALKPRSLGASRSRSARLLRRRAKTLLIVRTRVRMMSKKFPRPYNA